MFCYSNRGNARQLSEADTANDGRDAILSSARSRGPTIDKRWILLWIVIITMIIIHGAIYNRLFRRSDDERY